MIIPPLVALCCALLSGSPGRAAEFPFPLPEKISATLAIDTMKKQPVSPLLLGVNCGWPEKHYGIAGYNSPEASKVILAAKPPALRFPHGVWANFYDWECDGRRITDGYKGEYLAAVKNCPGLKYGFDGFQKLHDTLRFDVVFTWNVNYDSPEKGVRRLQDCRKRGFDARWIELGNEVFWKSQRSEATADVGKYIQVAKAHAEALKAVDPTIRISVPVHWREAMTDAWNTALMKEKFYDAISVHKYLTRNDTLKEAGETLGARREMIETGLLMRRAFPGRAIWITEWSASCGDPVISVLASVDTQLGMIEHPELFEMADYFQMNAVHPLFTYDRAIGKHTRTALGAAFQVLFDVVAGSERVVSALECTRIGDGVEVVSAAAVVRDGRVTLVVLNKTPRSVPLALTVNGRPFAGPYTHRALLLEQARDFDLNESGLHDIPSKSGGVTLPPLSISRVDLRG